MFYFLRETKDRLAESENIGETSYILNLKSDLVFLVITGNKNNVICITLFTKPFTIQLAVVYV